MTDIKSKEYLGLLGMNFQVKLLGELMIPHNINKDTNNYFFDEVIDLLLPNYFETLDMRRLMVMIKEYYQKNKQAPNIDNIETVVTTSISNDIEKQEVLARLENIKDFWSRYKSGKLNNDRQFVKSTTLIFIKQQEFLQVNVEIEQKLKRGIVDEATLFDISDKCKRIIDIGSPMNYGEDIFDKPENILVEDYRKPIGIGVKEIDDKIDGGLSEGEWALVLAGQGVGKSNSLTLIANNAYMSGKNVLHILLEGKKDDIKRKHYSKIFKTSINNLAREKNNIIKEIENLKKDTKLGNLKVERLLDDTTPNKLKKWIKRTEDKLGYKFDIICLDYIDCLIPNEKTLNPWDGQESVAKSIESMVEEQGWRMYVGIQGKKEATDKRILDMNDCGGSVARLKKAQLVIAIGADKEQKTKSLINVAILKCRFAGSGWTWEDCKFDNSILNFNINNVVSLVGEDNIIINPPLDQSKNPKDSKSDYELETSLKNKQKLTNVDL